MPFFKKTIVLIKTTLSKAVVLVKKPVLFCLSPFLKDDSSVPSELSTLHYHGLLPQVRTDDILSLPINSGISALCEKEHNLISTLHTLVRFPTLQSIFEVGQLQSVENLLTCATEGDFMNPLAMNAMIAVSTALVKSPGLFSVTSSEPSSLTILLTLHCTFRDSCNFGELSVHVNEALQAYTNILVGVRADKFTILGEDVARLTSEYTYLLQNIADFVHILSHLHERLSVLSETVPMVRNDDRYLMQTIDLRLSEFQSDEQDGQDPLISPQGATPLTGVMSPGFESLPCGSTERSLPVGETNEQTPMGETDGQTPVDTVPSVEGAPSDSQNTREGTGWKSSLKSYVKSVGYAALWWSVGFVSKIALQSAVQSMKASGPGPQAVPVVESFPCDPCHMYPLLESTVLF